MTDRVTKVSLFAQVNGYIAEFQRVELQNRKVAAAAGDVRSRMLEQQQAMGQVGRAFTAAGALAIAASALAAKAAVNWETAWTGVTKTVDGTPEQLSRVEDGLRGLAKQLPSTHAEIAGVAEAAGQLGVETQNVVAFTKTMVDLGETTNLSAQTAATELARFMNVMGTSQDKVSNLGSAVVDLGNNYATTEAEIVAMAQRLSGAGVQVGLSEGQVLGLATALSSVGVEAEAGGSAMSKVMINIASEVETGGDKLELFAEAAGMSADQFSAKWRTAPGEALAAFVQGLSDAESQGKSTFQILESLGITEVRMRDALLRSSAASEKFTAAMLQGNKAFDANNALTAEAEKRYATVASQLEIAKNKVVDAAIGFGQVFLPIISEAATAVGKLADFLGDMPEPVQGVIAVVVALGGAAATAGGLFLLAVPKIAEFQLALTTLSKSDIPAVASAATAMQAKVTSATSKMTSLASFLTGPWSIAITAATLGITALTKYLDSLKASSDEITASLTSARSAADVFATAGRGATGSSPWVDVVADLKDLDNVLQASADQYSNVFARFDSTHFGAFDALKRVGTQLGTLAQTDLPSAQRAFNLLAEETDGSKKRLWELLSNMPDYRDELIVLATTNGDYAETMSEAEKKQVLLNYAQKEGSDAASKQAATLATLEGKAADAGEEVEGLSDAIRGFGSLTLDARAAERDFQAALDDLTESVKENGLSLDTTTAAGRANEAALDDIAEASLRRAAAILEETGSQEQATTAIQLGRDALIEQLAQFGIVGAEAQAYADKLGLIPSNIDTYVKADTTQASSDVEAFIAAVQRRVANINFRATLPDLNGSASGSGRMGTFSNGGFIDYHRAVANADGNIYTGGRPLYKFAEPETGWESFISGKPSARTRNVGIWAETGRRLGVWQPATRLSGAPAGASYSGDTFNASFMLAPPPGRSLAEQTIEAAARLKLRAKGRRYG